LYLSGRATRTSRPARPERGALPCTLAKPRRRTSSTTFYVELDDVEVTEHLHLHRIRPRVAQGIGVPRNGSSAADWICGRNSGWRASSEPA
jgi:hypothetical protein